MPSEAILRIICLERSGLRNGQSHEYAASRTFPGAFNADYDSAMLHRSLSLRARVQRLAILLMRISSSGHNLS
jgi:hypothetical protein